MRKLCNRCGGKRTNLYYREGSCLSSQEIYNMDYFSMFTSNNNLNNMNNITQSKSQMINTNQNVNQNSNNQYSGRSGDWICFKCNNLNFSFRTHCNRCHLPKNQNQRLMFQQKYVRNLLYGNQKPV